MALSQLQYLNKSLKNLKINWQHKDVLCLQKY